MPAGEAGAIELGSVSTRRESRPTGVVGITARKLLDTSRRRRILDLSTCSGAGHPSKSSCNMDRPFLPHPDFRDSPHYRCVQRGFTGPIRLTDPDRTVSASAFDEGLQAVLLALGRAMELRPYDGHQPLEVGRGDHEGHGHGRQLGETERHWPCNAQTVQVAGYSKEPSESPPLLRYADYTSK